MTDLDPSYAGVTPQAQALRIPSVRDLADFEEGRKLRDRFDRALATGDDAEAEQLGKIQQQIAGATSVRILMEGGNPLTETRPGAASIHPIFEVTRRAFHLSQAESQIRDMLAAPEAQAVFGWWRDVEARYKAQNESSLAEFRPGMSPEAIAELQQRLVPVTTDPNETAQMRQVLTQLSQQMQQASGGVINAWNHPATRRIAEFINRETAVGTPGFIRSGEQELPFLTEYGAQPVATALEVLGEPMFKLGLGAYSFLGTALDGITGGAAGWSPPLNWVETSDGQIVPSSEKLPSMIGMFLGARAALMNEDMGKAIARWDAAKEHAFARSSGLGQTITGATAVGGMFAGFLPTAAAGAKVAKWMEKGLQYLGALGKTSSGTQATLRGKALMQLVGGAGQASAFALQEGISTGSPDRFLEGLTHGAQMGLVAHVLGQMGRGVERLAKRKNMPAKIAEGLGVTTEALGFTALELADMQGSMWELIKNPSSETWSHFGQAFAKNWLGILMGRGIGVRMGEGPGARDLTAGVRALRQTVGEQLRGMRERGEKPTEQVSEQIAKMGAKPEQLEELATLSMKARKGDVGAAVRRAELERQLEAQEAGVGRTRAEDVERALERAEKPEAELTVEEQLGRTEEALKAGDLATAERLADRLEALESERMTTEQSAQIMEVLRRVDELAEQKAAEPARAEAPEPVLGSMRAEKAGRLREAVPGTEPVRKSDIVARMQGFEGDPIRTPQKKGRISGQLGMTRSTKGFFDRNRDLIRVRGESELAERAHEFAHAAQEAAIGIGGKVLPRQAEAEAQRMLEGYGGREELTPEQVYDEAWAEYHARDLLGEQRMAEQFPELAKVFAPELAKRPGVLRQYRETKALFERYLGQGAYQRISQFFHALGDRPSPEAKLALRAEQGGPVRRMVRRANEWMFQDIERLSWSLDRWTKIAGIDPGQLPLAMRVDRVIETLRSTEAARAASFLGEGVMRGGKRGISAKQVLEPIKSPEQRRALGSYLVARRMWEMQKGPRHVDPETGKPTMLREEPLQVGFERAELLRAMHEAGAALGGVSKAEGIARDLKRFFDDLIRWTAEEGMMTPLEAETIVGRWSSYVPFQRHFGEALRAGLGVGGGLKGRLKGGIEEIADPFEAMVQVTTSIVRQVHQHKAIESLYQLGRRLFLGGLVEEVPPEKIPQEFTVERLLKELENQIGDLPGERQHQFEYSLDLLRDALGDEAAVSLMLFRPNFNPSKNKPLVLHRTAGGQRKWLLLDKDAYEAIQSVENPGTAARALGALEKTAAAAPVRIPTQLIRFFATGTSLTFAARNMFRDAALFPGYSKVPRSMVPWSGLVYFGRGVKRMLRAEKDPELAKIASLYRAMGAEGISYFASEIRQKRGSELLFGREARTPRTLLQTARSLLEKTIGRVVDVGEQALRFEEFVEVYRARRKEGMSESQAALEALEGAKEVTINFTRAGMLSRQLNQLIPYFNASMQGMRKTFRAFSGADGDRQQKVAWANLASTVGVTTALTHWLYGDEDWFKDLQPWQRFASWHFKLGDQIAEIPKPHLPAWTVTSIFDQLFSENAMTPSDILGELKDQLLMDHLALPSLIAPFVEWTTDYSFWRGRELVPDWLERSRVGPDQFNAYTDGWAKWVSRVAFDAFGVEMSPIKVSNFGNSVLGGLPSRAQMHFDGLAGMLGWKLDPERKETLDQIPILSTFFRHYAHRGSRAVQDFYDHRARIERRYGSQLATPEEKELRNLGNDIAKRLGDLRTLRDQQVIDSENFARQSYELVLPFIERVKQ